MMQMPSAVGGTGRMQLLSLAVACMLAGIMEVSGQSCQQMFMGLALGPCAPLSNAAIRLASTYANSTCPSLWDALDSDIPPVNSACCRELRSFLGQGCTCNDGVLGFLNGVGARHPEVALEGATRLAQASICSDSDDGGPLLDYCSGATGCGPMTSRRK